MTTATATQTGTCYKCGGSGYIPTFSNIAAGVCFTCKGTGTAKFSSRNVSAVIIPEDDALTARRIEAIHNADLSKWSYRQLWAARQFAVARIDTTPGVYDAWMERGEGFYLAKLEE